MMVGNVMIDTLLAARERAMQSNILSTLGLAERGELRGDVLDGAVPLAQLDAGERAGARLADGAGGCREAVGVQGLDQGSRTVGDAATGLLEPVGVALLEGGDAVRGELLHGALAAGAAQEAQRVTGEVVVVADKRPVTALGEHPRLRGPAPAAGAGGLAGLDQPLGVQGVDLAAHGGLGEAEPVDQGGDADRPLLAHDAQDPVAGARLEDVGAGINHTPMLGNCGEPVQGRVT